MYIAPSVSQAVRQDVTVPLPSATVESTVAAVASGCECEWIILLADNTFSPKYQI